MLHFARSSFVVAGLIVLTFAGSSARAGFFVNALASSPLETFVFGDFSASTAATADSETFFTNGADVYSARGFADSDLGAGVLHSLISASFGYDAINPATGDPFGDQFPIGHANFGDSLRVLGSFNGEVVTFHATVSGEWSNLAGDPSIGGAKFQFVVLPAGTIDQHAGNTFEVFDDPTAITNVSYDVGPTQSFPLQIDIPVTLTGINPAFDFAAKLDVLGLAFEVGQSFTGDFTNSADLTFTAPNGAVVQSASGAFPGTTAVPEPGTLFPAIVGIVMVGLAVARRRLAVSRVRG